jgi:hypothetical protein
VKEGIGGGKVMQVQNDGSRDTKDVNSVKSTRPSVSITNSVSSIQKGSSTYALLRILKNLDTSGCAQGGSGGDMVESHCCNRMMWWMER